MAAEPTKAKLTLPWKVHLLTSLLSTLGGASRRSNATINYRLFNLADRQSLPNPTLIDGVSSSAIFATSLNVVVVSVYYRLAPEHRYPSQYHDDLDVLKFLDQNDNVLSDVADVSKCFLAGDSMGANLTHHVAVRISKEKLQMVNVIGLVSGKELHRKETGTQGVPTIPDHNIQSTTQGMTQALRVGKHLRRVMDSDGGSPRCSCMCPPTPTLNQCSTSSDCIS
ncbi:hypothetical protein JHK82_025290 [Glycine max]|uniref:Putative carboxylesterase 18 n=1 Tax=Glycine soja TaxID=3848 RepID=A0A445J1J9_GLYSO|nr:hypothetical protein JHK86_025410 [Glycine max]KAG5134102.1 hypothetical protein JHK82_025290 [Glycine max]RZB92246.1 putative carboxylesterase 18 [Glycine soja]